MAKKAKIDLTKESFVEWHGQKAWDNLCKPLYNDKDFLTVIESKNQTVEGFVNRFVIGGVLHLLGRRGNQLVSLLSVIKELTKPVTRVLHIKTEWGPEIYDASSGEAFEKAALHALKFRIDNEIIIPDDISYYERELKKKPKFTKEEISKWDDGLLKDAALTEWKHHEDLIKQKAEAEQEKVLIDKALKQKDGKAAMQVLNNHLGDYNKSVELINITAPK